MSRFARWASLAVVCLAGSCGAPPEPAGANDADLRAAVLVALALDPETRPLGLEVASGAGEIVVAGRTTTLAQQQYALTVAAGVPGVRVTLDNMTLSDAVRADIQQRVEASLSATPELAGTHIEVSVGDGTVTLLGDDTDRDQRELAVQIAGSHENVNDVVDLMR